MHADVASSGWSIQERGISVQNPSLFLRKGTFQRAWAPPTNGPEARAMKAKQAAYHGNGQKGNHWAARSAHHSKVAKAARARAGKTLQRSLAPRSSEARRVPLRGATAMES
jgi:hypothetical protein